MTRGFAGRLRSSRAPADSSPRRCSRRSSSRPPRPRPERRRAPATGERFRIATERDFGDDLRTSTRVEIVDERYVGIVETGEGGVSIGVTAAIFDARKAKRLHSSSPRCDADDDDFRGPDDVVFLPKGGMAFTCGPLWLFENAAQKQATQLEPATATPRSLGLADGFIDRLYWTPGDGTIKSLDLS